MSISQLEEQLYQEQIPIQAKEGYEQMVKTDADFDWEEMTDTSSRTNLLNVQTDDVDYRRRDVYSTTYEHDSSVFAAKALAKAYEILSENSRRPDIHYSWGKSTEGFVTVPENDIHFTAQKLPYHDEDRMIFSLYLDRPSKYTNPRYKASFYSEIQQEMEDELHNIEKSLMDKSFTDKILDRFKQL